MRVAQKRIHRLLVRHGIAGELVAQDLQREFEARRQLQSIGGSFGQIGEEPLHLFRRLDITLAVPRQQAARSIERAMIANAGKDIEDLALFGLGILRTLRRQQRQAQAARKLDCRLVASFLRAIVVALQLDVNIFAAVDRDKLFEGAAACFQPRLVNACASGPSSPPVMQINPVAYSARSASEKLIAWRWRMLLFLRCLTLW